LEMDALLPPRIYGKLGHGGRMCEPVPRLIEALVGKNVIAATASGNHTAAWTEAGELFTFGYGWAGSWATEGHRMSLYRGLSRPWRGHGGHEDEFVPRLIATLVGKRQ